MGAHIVWIASLWGASVCILGSVVAGLRGRNELDDLLTWTGDGFYAVSVICCFLQHWYETGAGCGLLLALAIWLRWRKWRKRRKRTLDALGAKSRALRDALVRRARESVRPRPVLRPVPVPR